jgi:hypothetical protein
MHRDAQSILPMHWVCLMPLSPVLSYQVAGRVDKKALLWQLRSMVQVNFLPSPFDHSSSSRSETFEGSGKLPSLTTT